MILLLLAEDFPATMSFTLTIEASFITEQKSHKLILKSLHVHLVIAENIRGYLIKMCRPTMENLEITPRDKDSWLSFIMEWTEKLLSLNFEPTIGSMKTPEPF